MLPRNSRSSSLRGFTLVELLVSVGLTAILMWGILQLYTQATRFSATMFAEAEMVTGGRAVLERMCHELASAATLDVGYLQITRDPSSGLDTLQFVAPVGPDGEMADVCYQVRQDSDGTYMLYRCVKSPVTYNSATGVVVIPDPPTASVSNGFTASALGVKVEGITLQYIEYNSTTGAPEQPTGATPRRWLDDNVNDATVPRLPRAILVELRLADGKGIISMVLSSGAFLGGSGV